MSSSFAEIAGPGLTGILVQLLTAPMAILVDALSFLASALTVWLVRKPEAGVISIPGLHIWEDFTSGLRAVTHSPISMLGGLVSSASTSAAAPKYSRSRTNAAGAGRRWRRAGVCRESSLQSADHLPEGKKPAYLSTPRDSHHRVECARHCFPCARATQMVLRRTRSWNMR